MGRKKSSGTAIATKAARPHSHPAQLSVPTETVSLSSLTLDPANVRQHPERNKVATEASLRRFGAARSIVVDGKGVVRAGNGTVEAARAAGIDKAIVVDADGDQLVVVRRKDWSPSEATAYAIADNRVAEHATWEETGLAEVLRSLQSEDFDLEAVGYSSDEFDALLAGLANGLGGDGAGGNTAPDPGPQLDRAAELQAKWGTEAGQLWEIPSTATPGRSHRLLCGDSTRAEEVGRLMGGEKADIVLADPPYGVNCVSRSHRLKELGYKQFAGDETPDLAKAAYGLWCQLAPVHVWWGANHYSDGLPVSRGWLFWDKDHPGMDFGDGELAWTNRNVPIRSFRHAWSGADRDSEKGEDRLHPTQKPIALAVWCIDQCAATARLVADPFGGAGFSLVASEQTGRLCYAMELAPEYVAVTLERLAGLGLEPRLAV